MGKAQALTAHPGGLAGGAKCHENAWGQVGAYASVSALLSIDVIHGPATIQPIQQQWQLPLEHGVVQGFPYSMCQSLWREWLLEDTATFVNHVSAYRSVVNVA